MLSVLLHLGYGFVRASLRYPFMAGRGGERFLRAYGPEGLLPVTAEHRAEAAALERCIGCGLCELALGDDPALHDLAISHWRSPLSPRALVEILSRLDDEALAEAEAGCPAEVPFRTMVRELLTWREPRDRDLPLV